MKDIFNETDVDEFMLRIDQLDPTTSALWGKMSVDQMLAHVNVAYEFIYTDKHKRPNFLMRFLAKTFAKQTVVSERPYPKNGRTAPVFIIEGARDFEKEKQRLKTHLKKTMDLGRDHFEGKESLSFGKLSSEEWNNLFSKHLDHHLTQFGV